MVLKDNLGWFFEVGIVRVRSWLRGGILERAPRVSTTARDDGEYGLWLMMGVALGLFPAGFFPAVFSSRFFPR